MPKAAATQVIIHRIELQETERDLLKSVVAAYSFKNVTKGVFNLTSDVTTIVALLIVIEWITGKEVLTGALLENLVENLIGIFSGESFSRFEDLQTNRGR